jgi:phosphoribosylglycinamide formyltransferase-1
MTQANLLILASGSGSNAENIIDYFAANENISVAAIGSNKPGAFVLERAKRLQVPSFVFSKKELQEESLSKKWDDWSITHIILAGFLLKIPVWLIKAYSNRIVNIHPALLPKYGGKGMFGHHVHEAVKESGDTESGITIHLVNENYDEGRIIFQASCEVNQDDTPDSIASKVHQLEYQHFPRVIEDYILGKQAIS